MNTAQQIEASLKAPNSSKVQASTKLTRSTSQDEQDLYADFAK